MSEGLGSISAYFSHLVSRLGARREFLCVVVAHMVPNTLHFASALDEFVTLAALLPKPKSVKRPEYEVLKDKYRMLPLNREWAADAVAVAEAFKEVGLGEKQGVVVDIGGYFAQSIDSVNELLGGSILGVMEGTANGAAKYRANGPHSTPIITVADSPLKLPEDYLVGSSVVFSIEAVLRDQAEIYKLGRQLSLVTVV